MHFDISEVENRFDAKLFETLLGGEYDFYGVDNNCFCIGINGTRLVLEAVEDPDDGFRSYFGCFRTTEANKIFFKNPICRVKLLAGGESEHTYFFEDEEISEDRKAMVRRDNFSGWILQDCKTGHTWLTVGTDHGEDYYPLFAFRYTPDTNNTIEGI